VLAKHRQRWRKRNPYTGMDRSLGHQDVEAPRFEDNWHMNVVTLSALRTGRLNPPGDILVLISVWAWDDRKDVNEKFQWHHRESNLLAHCLNQLRRRVPALKHRNQWNSSVRTGWNTTDIQTTYLPQALHVMLGVSSGRPQLRKCERVSVSGGWL